MDILSLKEIIEFAFMVLMTGTLLFVVLWGLYKLLMKLKNEKIQFASKQEIIELDTAFNDLDKDYWALEKRVSYLEWTINLRIDQEGTKCLPDLSEIKRSPGRPKKID
jgi:hypothetical protein